MIFLLVAAALVAGAPLVAALLVSIASVREDAAKSLAGRPRGLCTAAARRLVQASIGDAGPVRRRLGVAWPLRAAWPMRAGPVLRRPRRENDPDQVPAPQGAAGGEGEASAYGALATPRG